jgi:hypothetical protein
VSGQRLTKDQKLRYLEFRRAHGPTAAAREFRIARSTGDGYWKEFLRGPTNNPNPKAFRDLDADAKRAVGDFRFFAERYLGLWTIPVWDMVAGYLGGQETDPDPQGFRRILLTFHPGFGKTTLILAYILWRVTRARALGQFTFAATFGSKTDKQTGRAGRQLRNWMGREQLVKAFGKFKPGVEESATWSTSMMVVAGMDPEKEATIALWSRGESISGVRPHLAAWDDLVDEKSCDPESTDNDVEWWDGVADGRVEPGGTIVVSGVYWSPQDFYHVLKDRVFLEEDGTETPKWRHFRFPAHNEVLCPMDGTHPMFDPSTNTGCLLNPTRWSYRQLMYYRSNNEDLWELQYQQNDLAHIDVLVPRIWWFGGRTAEGQVFPGCVNKNRSVWEWPAHSDLTVACLDPSPTMFIGAGIWDWDRTTNVSTLIDVERRRMSPAEYPGFIEAWTLAIREHRPRFEHWVIERTGAIYLLDNAPVMDKLRSLGIQLVAHETRQQNKAHVSYGVNGLIQPEAKFGRLDVPYRTPDDRLRMAQFEREMLNYPHARFDDTVMQTWFYLHHRLYLVASMTRAINRWAPGWVRTMKPKPGAALWSPAGRR